MMSAKEHGVAVHLWAVQAADGDYNQSEDLVAEADERRVLDRAWITKAVRAKDARRDLRAAARPAPRDRRDPLRAAARVRASPPPPSGPPRPAARQHAADRPAPAEHRRRRAGRPRRQGRPHPQGPGRASRARRGPAARPRSRPASATLRWSSDKGWVDRAGAAGEPAETAALPTLAQLTSAEQRWADREEDITTVGGDPFEVGQVFARRWMDRLPDTVASAEAVRRCTRASRTASTASCCGTRPASACSPTRTTRSTSTTGTRSGRGSGARSTCGRRPSTRPPGSRARAADRAGARARGGPGRQTGASGTPYPRTS